ncbi:amino acid permease [Lentilactobacillus hilgardii]|jgi:AAT family amino acid transporter|uniref:Amino acid permease n=1 Tax=Lentilactobacillus hilgardii TaxID=1588 RepID=A0A6P1E0J6_LENHI|nr:amino acid permease [Lentilactobacillus hilgardii]EEI72526.1 amino acid permease [Lentilactobacillus hilgardii ATCC 27305]MCT3392164.1 amino acid permease [Lentilactobacillus hilgardii]QHB50806.1 amino acid permease [Lentilactobacillus hilgardii]RRG11526.1 MAG: amino acid permease [Lactobacillus sp.]
MKEKSKIRMNADGTKRELSNRHVQMIALGGTIGTGLFLGAGTSITKTGPSIIFIYAVIGIFFFLMMRAIGEMLYKDPSEHTFIAFISRYLGPKMGYFAGWSYWLELIFIGMAELTAISTYVRFWFPNIDAWMIQIAILVILAAVNLIAVKLFGEAEFWFAMIKIIAIIAMIVTGIIMVTTSFKTPIGHAGLNNIFEGFKFFPNGIVNFIGAFPMVFFAFQGMEFVGITTAETKDPHKVLPKAINETIYRILLFYIGAIIVIMAIYPWHSLSANQSPFVQVFALAGLKAAAGVINFVVLTSASSSLNSFLYSAGRHFYQLASESQGTLMPKFKSVSKSGVPAKAIVFSAALIMLAPVISSIPGIENAFTLICSATSDLALVVYLLTVIAHYKYRQSIDFDPNGFVLKGYKWIDPALIGFFIIIYLSLFFNGDGTIPAIAGLIWCIGFGLWSSREKSSVSIPNTESKDSEL